MTKCEACLRKPSLLKCKDCSGQFCSGCIQLETHRCPMLDARKQMQLKNLEKVLVKVESQKIVRF